MKDAPRNVAIRVSMLPKDTNGMGTIFGGVILSYLDLAGAVEARRVARHVFVTKAMNEVVFEAPVFVGETVSFYTAVCRVGKTSVTVCIEVEVERRDTAEVVRVTTANVTYVAVDEARRPLTLDSPPARSGP